MKKEVIFLLLAALLTAEATEDEESQPDSGSPSSQRDSKQLIYSPFLFPGNYQAGLSSSFPSTQPRAPLLHTFWSNLQSVPALQKGQNGASQVPVVQQDPLQIITIDPENVPGQGQPLAYSRVHQGNVWNYNDNPKHVGNTANDPLVYYFPFANPEFGSQLDKSLDRRHEQNVGFHRGNVEAKPGNNFEFVKNSYVAPPNGFSRGHVESPPSQSPYGSRMHENIHDIQAHNSVSSSFNRGAVEGVPQGNLGKPSGYRAEGDKKIVCYFANWAWNRKGKAAFVPENIDPTLCTHVVYAFATYDKNSGNIAPSDVYTDITNDFYGRTVALKQKNPNLKVLLAMGGWADSGDDKYSNLAHSPQARSKFARLSLQFLKKHGFDGLAVDWHYPKCWQSNCEAGPGSDSVAFGDLLRELRNAYQPEGLLLSATLSGYKEVIDVAYHVPTLSGLLDLMNIMVYDYHGAWETKTGHVAPLFQGPAGYDEFPYYNANFTLEYYVALGADRSKLIMGIPMYGQTFALKERGNTQVGTDANGPGEAGEFTQQPGMLAYYEICDRVRNQHWTIVRDRTSSWGPVAYDSRSLNWVGYDDPEFVARKSRFVMQKNYGGAFVWTMDLDDFNNDCCGGAQPLLRTIARELMSIPFDTRQQSCAPPAPPATPPPPATSTFLPSRPTQPSNEATTSSVWWRPTSTTTTNMPATTTTPWWTTSTRPTTTTSKTTTTTSTTRRPTTTTSTTTTTTTQRPQFEAVTPNTTTTQAPPPQSTIIISCIQGKPSPVETTTTMRPQTPPPGSSVAMGQLQEGAPCQSNAFMALADPNDCQTYYLCIYDTIKVRRCPSGLHYNAHAQTCDWPHNAMCARDKEVTTTYRPIMTSTVPSWTTMMTSMRPQMTSQASQTRPPNEAVSSECMDGHYYPGPTCDSYYLCLLNRRTVQRCGPGLHWNREKTLCDWPREAKCTDEAQKVIEETDQEIIGQSCQEGEYAPSTSECSTYYICVHGRHVMFKCQGGLYWNQQGKNCDWPANSECRLSPPGTISEGSTGMPMPTRPPSFGSTLGTTTTMAPMRPPPPQQIITGQDKPINSDFMIVCYFTNWAWYRKGFAQYKPEHINSNLCTHVVYGFAVLDYENLVMKVFDSWADIDNRFYEQVVELKSRGIKVSIAIGGWNDSEGDKYSRMVSSPQARRRFVQTSIDFIKKYDFDGLDLDWEYPKCWQVNCNKGPDSDKANFAALVRELKEAFRPHGYVLSAAVSPSKTVIDQGYDVPTLSKYLDWIAVMTYDYHGQWDKRTGHVAPLFLHEEDDNDYFNTNYTINYWIRRGADRKKIVLGMPLYGQSFTLEDPSNNGLNAPAIGGGQAGMHTRASGFLAYYEICHNVQREGWTVVPDSSGAMGPYAYRGNQWVSFDDVQTIARKSQLIRDMDLGGGMIWALDLDDFRNVCGQGEYPLLTTIKNVLSAPRGQSSGMAPIGMPSDINKVQGGKVTQKPMMPVTQRPVNPIKEIDNSQQLENDVCTDEPFRPHETDCNKYYQCLYGRYVSNRCPPGTFWNTNRCDWECGMKPGSGGSGSATTQRPTTAMSTTTYRPPYTSTTTMYTSTTMYTTMSTTPSYTPSSRPPLPPNEAPQPLPEIGEPSPTSSQPFVCPNAGPKPDWEPAAAKETNTAKPLDVPNTGYKVVCYFTNWAWYRPGIGKYKPSDIDFNLCTHIAYGFAVLDTTNLVIKAHDGWADFDNKFYRQVVQLKARGLKVVLAIGGWNDSAGDKYSRLVNNPAARRKFIQHVIEFLERHCFDGLDLDWEYPKCWQVDCNKGPDSDKQGFSDFVRELGEAFKPRGLLLSAAVSPSKTVIDQGYDVPVMSKYMDWISVMTYDYHGQWDKKTGHVAPMYEHEEDDNVFFNTNYTMHYWMQKGADPKKLIMGMPTYGQSFTLVDTKQTGLNSKSSGGGTAGEFTRQSGFLAYYEICRHILNRSWRVEQDETGAMGPYAHSGNQWVSFDDIQMIQRKSQYIRDMKLGGGMIWALDLDDFRNVCGCGRHPLLKTINKVLRNYRDSEVVTGCQLS